MGLLETPITLPCGAVLKNRFCKAAMTEGLADELNRATDKHMTLYTRWADGGTGLLLTGNIQVDRRYMERPGNIAIEGEQNAEQLQRLCAMAKAGSANNTHIWVQLNHAGRQSNTHVNKELVGPGDIPVNMMGANYSAPPRPLSIEECEEIPAKFAHAAVVCMETGFTGVQVHAAHGYLLSSFLNPRANNRSDEFGGSLENRARLLLATVREVRKAVGPKYPVSVKLNSADFQKGGFTHEEAIQVAVWLDEAGIDMLELSGGNYESPALMVGPDGVENVYASPREAYFLDFSRDIKPQIKRAVVMVTGGFRSQSVMEAALESGACDIIGLGRPLCVIPDAPNKMMRGELPVLPTPEHTLQLGYGPMHQMEVFTSKRALLCSFWFMGQILYLADGYEGGYGGLLATMMWVQYHDVQQARHLEGINCKGTFYGGPKPPQEGKWQVVGTRGVLANIALMAGGVAFTKWWHGK